MPLRLLRDRQALLMLGDCDCRAIVNSGDDIRGEMGSIAKRAHFSRETYMSSQNALLTACVGSLSAQISAFDFL